MKSENDNNRANGTATQDSDEMVPMYFTLPQSHRDWLTDRKARGESAATIMRGFVRTAKEEDDRQKSTAALTT